MSAFTYEQQKILAAAFDHVWAVVSALHDDLSEDSARIAGLALIAVRRGLLADAADLDDAVAELTVEPASNLARRAKRLSRVTENVITRRILAGDVDALTAKRRRS